MVLRTRWHLLLVCRSWQATLKGACVVKRLRQADTYVLVLLGRMFLS